VHLVGFHYKNPVWSKRI